MCMCVYKETTFKIAQDNNFKWIFTNYVYVYVNY